MKTNTFSSEERAEYEQALFDVVMAAAGTGERVDLMEERIADAVQAHRFWAIESDREARRTGYAAQIKSYLKRNRVLFAYNGECISKPRVIGTAKQSSEGNRFHAQELIEALTFDELREKRVEYLRQIRSYNENIALLDRLIALGEMCPGATTPAEAATSLAINIETYLAAEAA